MATKSKYTPNPPVKYRWKKGQSGNPTGMKKGTKHLATWIQEMLNDEIDFKILVDRKEGKPVYQEFSGAPVQAIVAVAIHQAMLGNKDARDWLAKYGYGAKLDIKTSDPVREVLKRFGLLEGDNDVTEAEETPS